MRRKVTSLADQMWKPSNPNRRILPQSIRFLLILASLEYLTVGPPRRKSVCLYGQPGRKHRSGSWSGAYKARESGRLVRRQSERPIMRPCFMGGLGHTFKWLGESTDLAARDDTGASYAPSGHYGGTERRG